LPKGGHAKGLKKSSFIDNTRSRPSPVKNPLTLGRQKRPGDGRRNKVGVGGCIRKGPKTRGNYRGKKQHYNTIKWALTPNNLIQHGGGPICGGEKKVKRIGNRKKKSAVATHGNEREKEKKWGQTDQPRSRTKGPPGRASQQ